MNRMPMPFECEPAGSFSRALRAIIAFADARRGVPLNNAITQELWQIDDTLCIITHVCERERVRCRFGYARGAYPANGERSFGLPSRGR